MSEPLLVSDIIMLTKKEVEEARRVQSSTQCGHFLRYVAGRYCSLAEVEYENYCHLCKKLTQFVSQGDPEEEVVKDVG